VNKLGKRLETCRFMLLSKKFDNAVELAKQV
jgi:hypothetical protein